MAILAYRDGDRCGMFSPIQSLSNMVIPYGPSVGMAATLSPSGLPVLNLPLPAYQAPPMLRNTYTSPLGYPVHFYVLPNGHRVVIEQRPTNAISLRTFVNAGSVQEDALKAHPDYTNTGFPAGLAHLDEHCHFLTTAQHPLKNSWPGEVEQLGAEFNASTSDELIQHELVFNRDDLPRMLQLHGESVMRPVYNDVDINQEKKNVLNERELRLNKPEVKVYDALTELMFDRPSMQQTVGTADTIGQITAQHLQRFHQAVYTPTNMVTVLSGNVDPNQVLPLLAREFGSNPARVDPLSNRLITCTLRPGEIRGKTIIDPQLQHSEVGIAFPAPSRGSLKERAAMEMLGYMLTDGAYPLLTKEVQEQQRLATNITASYDPYKQTGMLTLGAQAELGQEQAAATAMVQTASKLAHPQFWMSPAKLNEIKDVLAARYDKAMALNAVFTEALGNEALTNSMPYVLQYKQILSAITLQDVKAVAQKYLRPDTYVVSYAVPPRPEAAQYHAGTVPLSLEGGATR